MRVYVASPYEDRGTAAAMATILEGDGHKITRKWWLFEGGDENFTPQQLQDIAREDALGVLVCDVLVVLNTRKSEGKAVEQGLALGRRLVGSKPRIMIIGDKTKRGNIFQRMAQFEWFENIEQVGLALRKMEGR